MKIGPFTFGEKAPQEGQIARAGDTVFGNGDMWNQDAVVRRKGFSYLRGMDEKNAFLMGLMRSRVDAVKRRGFVVSPAGDDATAQKVAEATDAMLEWMEGSTDDLIVSLMEAVRYGYAIAELIWEPWDSPFGTLWGIRAVKPLAQEHIRFRCDEFGNIEGMVQERPKREVLDPEKFVIATFGGRPGNPYGKGLYSNIYWHDWFMREGWRFWAVACERYGMPIAKMTVPRNASSETRDEAQSLLDEVQSAAGVVLPEDIKLELEGIVGSGRMSYEGFLASQKEAIQIAILGQTLTSTVGSTGSRALGDVHLTVKDEITDSDCEWLYTPINEQVVRRFVDVNFSVREYPTVHPPVEDDVDLDALAVVTKDFMDRGMAVSKQWVQKTWGIVPPEDEEDALVATPRTPVVPGALPFAEDGTVERFADGVPATVKRQWKRTDAMTTESRGSAKAAWKVIRDGLIKQAEPAFEKKSQRGIEFKPRMREFEAILMQQCYGAWLNGRASGLDDVDGCGVEWQGEDGEAFAEGAERFAEYQGELLEPAEALAWHRARIPVDGAAARLLKREALESVFFVSSSEGVEAVKVIKSRISEALSNGWGIGDFRRAVEKDFADRWIGDVFGSGLKDQAMAEARLATCFRTNVAQAIAKGREEIIRVASDPAQATNPVVACTYLAVMDDRVRPSHAAMHGKTFRIDDPIWRKWNPPNGFACRCMKVPVLESKAAKMKAEELSTKPPTVGGVAVEPDKGWGRTDFAELTDMEIDEEYRAWWDARLVN